MCFIDSGLYILTPVLLPYSKTVFKYPRLQAQPLFKLSKVTVIPQIKYYLILNIINYEYHFERIF